MKNKYRVGAALMLLSPVMGQAAAINWASESYSIYALADIDVPEINIAQVNQTASSLSGLPLADAVSLSTADAIASVDLSVMNLIDPNASLFQFAVNGVTSYSGGTNSATQYAYLLATAELDNSFVAQTNTLVVSYDYSVDIAYSAPSGGLSYQGMPVRMELRDTTNPFGDQVLGFANAYHDNFNSPTGASYTLMNNGTQVFSGLTIGRTYRVIAGIAPDYFTSGTIDSNSSSASLTIGFSDGNVAAVPEPETYAMLLAGLALVGFTARRKQMA